MKQAEKQTSFEPPGPTKKLSEKQPPPRPIALPVDPRKIPQELKKHRQWLVWRYEKRNSKWTKPPKNAENGLGGKSDDPSTWTSFEKTWKAYEKEGYDGIGFALSCEDGLVGLDLDYCFNKAGELAPWAREVVNHFPEAYWERSPGGEGLRGFCRGVPVASGKGGPNNWIEVYQPPSHRYLTVTGHTLPESPKEPGDGQKGLNWLYQTYWEKKEETKPGALRPPSVVVDLDDQELLEKAFHAQNGAEFSRLWNGDISNYPSASEADQALCNHLAFWTGGDAHRMEHLARQSGLCREKWDKHPTYLSTTIEKAISSCSQFYDPQTVANCSRTVANSSSARPQYKTMKRKRNSQTVATVATVAGSFDPTPLCPRIKEEIPYPTTILDGVIDALQRETQAPRALCANSVLSGATLAVQAEANVNIPGRGFRPINNFFLTVGESGERKSTADALVSRGHKKREAELREEQQKALPEYLLLVEIYDKEKAKILKNGKLSPQEKKEQIEALTLPPPPPLAPLLTVGSDPTYEGMYRLLKDGQPSLGLFSAEGGMFLGSHTMNRDNRLKTIAGLCSLWDGDRLYRIRGGDGADFIDGKRLSLHLAVQPDVSAQLLDDPLAKDQGLLSRVLVAYPQSTQGGRRFRESDPQDRAVLDAFNQRVLELLRRTPHLKEGYQNELEPRSIGFTEEGRQVWIEFYEEADAGILDKYEPVKAFAAKAAEHAARLAAVLSLWENPDAKFISADRAREGVALAKYYLHEALRVAEEKPDPMTRLAQQVYDWLCQGWEEEFISPTDICQFGPNKARTGAKAREVILLLQQNGLLEFVGKVEVRGKNRREGYQILKPPPATVAIVATEKNNSNKNNKIDEKEEVATVAIAPLQFATVASPKKEGTPGATGATSLGDKRESKKNAQSSPRTKGEKTVRD